MKECQNLQEFLQAFFPENAELEGFRKRLAADATPDREGLTEALREPDAGEQIRLFEGGDAAGLAAARSRAYSAAFYDACFPEAGSAERRFPVSGCASSTAARQMSATCSHPVSIAPGKSRRTSISMSCRCAVRLRSRAAAIWKS